MKTNFRSYIKIMIYLLKIVVAQRSVLQRREIRFPLRVRMFSFPCSSLWHWGKARHWRNSMTRFSSTRNIPSQRKAENGVSKHWAPTIPAFCLPCHVRASGIEREAWRSHRWGGRRSRGWWRRAVRGAASGSTRSPRSTTWCACAATAAPGAACPTPGTHTHTHTLTYCILYF